MSGSLKLPLGTKINYLTIVSYISIFNGKRNRFKYLCSCICGKEIQVEPSDLNRTDIRGYKSCGCKQKVYKLLNYKFSNLLVTEELPNSSWQCLCDCGNISIYTTTQLIKKYKTSCGCIIKPTKHNLKVGDIFNRLTIIGKKEKLNGRYKWSVSCNCGNPDVHHVSTNELVSGNTSSCGCLAKEKRQEYLKNYRSLQGSDPEIPLTKINTEIRTKLFKSGNLITVRIRDGHICQLCGIKETKNMKLFIHHIIPIHIDQSKSLDINNLISLCQECHFAKAHSGNYSKLDYSIVEQLQNKINTNLYGEMELCRVH